jgi:predicted nucleotidyltransferase
VNTPTPNPNLHRLIAAAAKLAPLLDQIAFVGGCITGLLLTDPAAAPIRPTLDVDAIVAVASYAEFTLLENRLRELGFRQPNIEGTPIRRWQNGDLILDLMPTDASILGFANRWYDPALENAQRTRIGEHEVRLITAPYFVATKLEAFHGRGHDDFRMSHDLEDIVTVIDGRAEIVAEVPLAAPDLRKYLSEEFGTLLSNHDFREALPGLLLPDAASQQRLGLVMKRMQQFLIEGLSGCL